MFPFCRLIASRVFLPITLVWSIVTTLVADEPSNFSPPATVPNNAIYDSQTVEQPRLSPEETVATSKLPDGFSMQVAAKSPDIQQPIGMCWDSRGRLWVVENYTYAEKELNFDVSLSDRLLIFEDTDQDGTLDSRKVFWDQGKKLTSIEIGYDGVWAIAAPYLLFIPDRNHDDIPDGHPEIVLDGFEHDSIRHNIANGLRWGPDGWLYGRHGIQAISNVGTPGSSDLERTRFSCCIWRWHPHRKKFDLVCQGTTNAWGHDWDKHGQLFFINTVIGHLWHAIPGAHLQRMYGDDFDSEVYELMPQIADHYHFDTGKETWSDIRKLGVSPSTDALGGGHAHSGMMIYQGEQWPANYRDKLFTLNFHGRRINVERLDRQGAGFVGRHDPDMVTFSDPWFRGIELTTGPDGNAWVLDWSDTGECHENDGVHRNSGTIYRIAYGDNRSQAARSDLRLRSDDELCNSIASPNSWLAKQSRLILSERAIAGKLASDTLGKLQQKMLGHENEQHRLAALWAMIASGLDKPIELKSLLKDSSEHVRLQAIHALVDPSREATDVTDAFLDLVSKENSDLVLLHLAGAMQKARGKQWWSMMTKLCQRTTLVNDRDYPLMLWYAIQDRIASEPEAGVQMLSDMASEFAMAQRPNAAQNEASEGGYQKLVEYSARLLASRITRDPQAIELLLAAAIQWNATMQSDVVKGIHYGLQGRPRVDTPHNWDAFAKEIAQHPNSQVRESLLGLQIIFGDGIAAEQLAKIVRDKTATSEARNLALESMTESRVANVKQLAYDQLRDRMMTPQAMKTILSIGKIDDAKKILAMYPDNQLFRFGVDDIMLVSLASRRDFIPVLLEAVENGKIDSAKVSASLLRQMQMMDVPAITEKLGQIWPQTKLLGRERLTQILAFEKGLNSETMAAAKPGKGRAVWDKLCASCHKLYGQGGPIGPELTGAQRTNLRYLTENILDPSATVAANYRISLILLDNATLVSGVVVAEDDATVTVQTVKERVTIAKEEIAERKTSTQSLMPEGLLDALDDSSRRDLIAYLMSSRQVEAE